MRKIMFNDQYGLTAATLCGDKTMTRRIVKCPKKYQGVENIELEYHRRWGQDIFYDCVVVDTNGHELGQLVLPYEVGDVVAIAQSYSNLREVLAKRDFKRTDALYDKFYRAMQMGEIHDGISGWDNKMFVKAEYMPHRIRITDLWFERLQDISDEDCLKEGIIKGDFKDFPQQMYFPYKGCKDTEVTWTPQGAFHILIDKVSGRGTWDSNPWVIAYTYKLIK